MMGQSTFMEWNHHDRILDRLAQTFVLNGT